MINGADSFDDIAKAMKELGLKDSFPKTAVGVLKEQVTFFKTMVLAMTHNAAFNDAVAKIEGAVRTLENEGYR